LIGLTPQHLETAEFYSYAHDINWSFSAHVDFFSLNSELFDVANTPNSSIGTLLGNADFFSALLDIPRAKFVEVTSLEQLVKMFAKGRLELVTFERIAIMRTIKRLEVKDIYYQKFGGIPASMAVANNSQGHALKLELDKLLLKVSSDATKPELNDYRKLPNAGIVTLMPPTSTN